MRTLAELHSDLAEVNVQEVARRSGVNPKTIYRIRQNPDYTPGVRKVERISQALDALQGQAFDAQPEQPQPAPDRRHPADLPVTVAMSGHLVAAAPADEQTTQQAA